MTRSAQVTISVMVTTCYIGTRAPLIWATVRRRAWHEFNYTPSSTADTFRISKILSEVVTLTLDTVCTVTTWWAIDTLSNDWCTLVDKRIRILPFANIKIGVVYVIDEMRATEQHVRATWTRDTIDDILCKFPLDFSCIDSVITRWTYDLDCWNAGYLLQNL